MSERKRPDCERCKGTGVEPEPTDEDVNGAIAIDLIPVACYDCHGHGEEREEEW